MGANKSEKNNLTSRRSGPAITLSDGDDTVDLLLQAIIALRI